MPAGLVEHRGRIPRRPRLAQVGQPISSTNNHRPVAVAVLVLPDHRAGVRSDGSRSLLSKPPVRRRRQLAADALLHAGTSGGEGEVVLVRVRGAVVQLRRSQNVFTLLPVFDGRFRRARRTAPSSRPSTAGTSWPGSQPARAPTPSTPRSSRTGPRSPPAGI